MRVTRGAKRRSRFPPVPELAYRWTRTGRWGAGQVRALPDVGVLGLVARGFQPAPQALLSVLNEGVMPALLAVPIGD